MGVQTTNLVAGRFEGSRGLLGGTRRFEVVLSEDRVVIRVGAVCVTLDRDGAEELLCLLADALEPDDPSVLTSTTSN